MALGRHTYLSALWVKQWKPASKLSICNLEQQNPVDGFFSACTKLRQVESKWSILEISSMHKLKRKKHTQKKTNTTHSLTELLSCLQWLTMEEGGITDRTTQ